jgi:hypothetical protein
MKKVETEINPSVDPVEEARKILAEAEKVETERLQKANEQINKVLFDNNLSIGSIITFEGCLELLKKFQAGEKQIILQSTIYKRNE